MVETILLILIPRDWEQLAAEVALAAYFIVREAFHRKKQVSKRPPSS